MKKVILYLTMSLLGLVAFGQNPVSIDTILTVNIGGIQQVLKICGKDQTKPILLYLHGAGGTNYSLITNANKITSTLQEHFVVVLWDQREYGKTFELNKSPKPLTVELIVNDAQEVVDYLLKKWARQKLYIVGHSMGSIVGIHIAQKHPELLHALIEISPGVHGIKSQKIGLSILKKHFKEINNERAVQELSTIKLPARDFESLFIRYIWQTEYDGEHISDTIRAQIKPVLQKWMQTSAASLSNEIFEMNFFKQFPAIKCPVYFFVGRKDFLTNAALSEQYYKKLKAPKKQFFWFEKSAHGLPDTEPELMQHIIIHDILPATQN